MAKASKADVDYQSSPKGAKRCERCTMFTPPASCTDVEGRISPRGYCNIFKTSAVVPTIASGY